MTIYCLYHSHDGVSHLTPLTLKMPEGQTRGRLFINREAYVSDSSVPRPTDWHCTPVLGISVVLKGFLDIEVNKSSPRLTSLVVGDVLIVLDIKTAREADGHRGRSHGPQGMSALMMGLAVEDLPALASNFANWPTDMAL